MVRAYSRANRVIRMPRPIGDGVCEIDLGKGLVALIDEIDAERCSVCCWCASTNGRNPRPYVKGRPVRGGSFVRLHRYILGFPDGIIDHISFDTLDNRRSNLRVVTASQSNANRGLPSRSKTGLKGVRQVGSRFVAIVRGRAIGRFTDPIAAAVAYDTALLNAFGEYAATNASLGLLEVTR